MLFLTEASGRILNCVLALVFLMCLTVVVVYRSIVVTYYLEFDVILTVHRR